MSNRSTEARQLALWLSQDTKTDFGMEWAGGRCWQVMWADGPAVTEVRASIASMMDVHERFLTLRDRELCLMRGYALRAWAALAVAARRDGSLAQALADATPTGGTVDRRPAHFTLQTFVEQLLERANYPGQEIPGRTSAWSRNCLPSPGSSSCRRWRWPSTSPASSSPPNPAMVPTYAWFPGVRARDHLAHRRESAGLLGPVPQRAPLVLGGVPDRR
ncbi:hypothetical protein [Streptacidiphilus sp. EB103A]|uniref:hypothetical protein n=1 Tax=Streptacidiphilus sp. EB103A TaxID=3156275 RepID=UPI003517EA84